MPGLILPYDFTLRLPERMTLPTPWEQEDGFKTLDQMNLRVVRLWNLPMRGPNEESQSWHYVLGPGKFNEEAFKVLDNCLALANKYHVRVIFDFTAQGGAYLGGIGTYEAYRGQSFWTDPQVKADYKATICYVLSRTNTITGVTYSNDKAVLAWQFGNEMSSAPQVWLAEMAAYIKSLDPNHLVAETRHMSGTPQVIDDNIDLYTRHYYTGDPNPQVATNWLEACRQEVFSLKGERPFFIGEFGPYIDGNFFTQKNVVDKIRAFLAGVREEDGISGALIWSMYFHHRNGGFYWHQIPTCVSAWSYHWPGFPSSYTQREQGIMTVLRESAFKIQGLLIPAVPVPDAPELLPFSEVPLLSWRGSAGSSGYDIERAPSPTGPWITIASNVSDADVVYRPLYSDTTAKAGQTWFYRVVARNWSDASAPSNIIGPVVIKRVCFVDELQDFSRSYARSESLKLNDNFNARYAEYRFRAKGSTNDWITYQIPVSIDLVKVTAFFAKGIGDLTVQVSPDGHRFSQLKPDRKERQLPSSVNATGDQARTLVEYEVAPPAEQRFLRIQWSGPAELDRVEIYHR